MGTLAGPSGGNHGCRIARFATKDGGILRKPWDYPDTSLRKRGLRRMPSGFSRGAAEGQALQGCLSSIGPCCLEHTMARVLKSETLPLDGLKRLCREVDGHPAEKATRPMTPTERTAPAGESTTVPVGEMLATVDVHRLPEVSKYHWRPLRQGDRVYAIAHLPKQDGKQRTLYLHRLIAAAAPGERVRHLDGDGLNNVANNLAVT